MSYKLFTIQLLFFLCQVFLLISHKVGEAKQMEKSSARSRLVQQVFFTLQNNQLSK